MVSRALLVVSIMIILHIAQGELQRVTTDGTNDRIESGENSTSVVLVVRGQNVILPCLNKRNTGGIVWMFGKQIISINSKMFGLAEKNIDVFTNSTGNYLRIENVGPENIGWYQCSANSHKITYSLKLEAVPVVVVGQKVIYGELGSKVKVTCRVTGAADTEVVWLKGGQTVPPSLSEQHRGDFDLVLNPVKRSDNGTYVCEATSRAGSANSTVHLFVTSHSSEASRSAQASSFSGPSPFLLLSMLAAALFKS